MQNDSDAVDSVVHSVHLPAPALPRPPSSQLDEDTEYSTLDCSLTDAYTYTLGNEFRSNKDYKTFEERQPFLHSNQTPTEIYDLVPEDDS
jgi:hypothetical protein